MKQLPKRVFNSPLVEYVNFVDGFFVNLIRLIKPYANGDSWAVYINMDGLPTKGKMFRTREKAKKYFDWWVNGTDREIVKREVLLYNQEPIKIVRLEYQGIGIFCSPHTDSGTQPLFNRVNVRHGDFPVPQEDGLDLSKEKKEWFCAYKTVEQLQQWITREEVQFFTTLGFKVYLLTVYNYQIGEYQVIFTKDSILSKEDVTELFI